MPTQTLNAERFAAIKKRFGLDILDLPTLKGLEIFKLVQLAKELGVLTKGVKKASEVLPKLVDLETAFGGQSTTNSEPKGAKRGRPPKATNPEPLTEVLETSGSNLEQAIQLALRESRPLVREDLKDLLGSFGTLLLKDLRKVVEEVLLGPGFTQCLNQALGLGAPEVEGDVEDEVPAAKSEKGVGVATGVSDLEGLAEEDLRALAHEYGIKLQGVRLRSTLIERIASAMQEQAPASNKGQSRPAGKTKVTADDMDDLGDLEDLLGDDEEEGSEDEDFNLEA